MSTHGCLLVKDERSTEGILLHTTHSAYLIPEIVEIAPKLVATRKKSYISDRKSAKRDLRSDGAVMDWLLCSNCICSLMIGAYTCFFTHVIDINLLPSWSGADNPWILESKNRLWFLTNPDTKEVKEINPVEIYLNDFPEL